MAKTNMVWINRWNVAHVMMMIGGILVFNGVWGRHIGRPLRDTRMPFSRNILGHHCSMLYIGLKQWLPMIYIRGVKQFAWPRFDKRLFQRDYWEHIIRNEPELNRIRHYIANNPAMWESNTLYGLHGSSKLNDRVHEPMLEYDKENWMV